jgi:glycosyltransferase involved in cell wall biosynthesis
MKIGIVVPGGVDRSGSERCIPCLLWLLERLAAVHDVHVFALRQEPEPADYPLLGARIHNIGRRPRRPRALAAITREHDRAPFDVLHAFWLPCGIVAGFASKLHGIPVVLHLSGGEVAALHDIGYGDARTVRGRAWLRWAASAAARVTVASTTMQTMARALGIQADCLTMGVALDRWPPAAPRPRSAGRARLLSVADINAVKDHTTLLHTLAGLREQGEEVVLDVVGVDTLNGQVQALARQLELEHVRFHGYVPHHELRPFYDRADLLVVSSRHEAGPIVALEAAIAGVPVVGTAVGHIAEWAPTAALSVPCTDSRALAAAITVLLNDDARRLAIAYAGQQIALREDADWTAARCNALYQELQPTQRRFALQTA